MRVGAKWRIVECWVSLSERFTVKNAVVGVWGEPE